MAPHTPPPACTSPLLRPCAAHALVPLACGTLFQATFGHKDEDKLHRERFLKKSPSAVSLEQALVNFKCAIKNK
jgi:hypothetical protein